MITDFFFTWSIEDDMSYLKSVKELIKTLSSFLIHRTNPFIQLLTKSLMKSLPYSIFSLFFMTEAFAIRNLLFFSVDKH